MKELFQFISFCPAPPRCAALFLLAVSSLAGAPSFSQSGIAPAGTSTTAASGSSGSRNGGQIAAQGSANGVTACASCHGAKGEGNAAANFPRLAAQPEAYLAHQLTSYANGSRNQPVMSPIAKAMTAQQIQAVAAYYASLAAPSAETATANAQAQKRGRTLAEIGDDKMGVQACANCHGPGGIGEAPTYPYLAGQHAGYLSSALAEWKNGTRNTDPSQQMVQIAKRLSESDAAALASYFAAQPAPIPEQPNIAGGSAARPAARAAKSAAGAAAVKGVGMEQGAPTSGGGQGVGGGGAASGSGPSGSKTGNAP